MRVTQSMLFKNQSAALSATYARLFGVQAQISSGRRLLAPSDDPAAIRPLLDLRAGRRRLEQVRSNADFVSGELGAADGALQNMSDLVARAREIAVSGANGTLTQAERDGMAIEVDGLLDQLLSLANSKGSAGYLFAGGAKDLPPFDRLASAGGTNVLYRGDDATTAVDFGDALSIGLGVPGSQLFELRGLGAPAAASYAGVTGAAAGSGNDSSRGTDRLTIGHTRTVLGDGALAGSGGTGDSLSGLRLGGSSAADDTVLGGGWSITLVDTSGTGASGTVSLNGGPAVAWTAADADLAVTAPNGEVVHLDLSGVTANFNGTVGVAGEGTLSLDGGATTTAIDFAAANQIVTDPVTGGSLFVDSRGIARTGTDVVRHAGTYDLFASLVELGDALRNRDGQALDVQVDRIRETLGEMERGQDRLLDALAMVGARSRLAETTRARADDLEEILAREQSNLEDVDVADASIELSQAELTLQAGLAVATRIAQLPSLATLL